MKFAIPEISWHNRDPVLSVDFQPKVNDTDPNRLATGGTDSHVLIWYISTSESGTVNLEVAADLTRHQKAVNVVRWAPNGQLLASGDDESIIFVWRQKNEEPAPVEQGEEQYKETWVIFKTLRGHMEDVLDLSWSQSSLHLASGSIDNKLIVWDVARAKHTSILTDHKGFVQGVAWDPKGQYLATASTDRVFRTFDLSSKKVTRSSKTILPLPSTHPLHNTPVRLYHDDTLQTYYRRVQWSPDGLLVAVPGGRMEPDAKDVKPVNAVYIYSRHSLTKPICVLPCGDSALVTRWSPCVYTERAGPTPAWPIHKRMILAIGTKRSVIVYDTQQKTPIAMISNIHYTRLTDLSWSSDGRTLVASSTDGFCSVVSFGLGELGELQPDAVPDTTEEAMEVDEQPPKQSKEQETKEANKTPPKPEAKATTPKIDKFMKFKAPATEKSPKIKKPDPKTPVKLDVLVETAMQSWSDNSNNDIIKPREKKDAMEVIDIEDSEDMKLVYEDTINKTDSPETKTNTDVKDSNKGEKELKKDKSDAAKSNQSPESKESTKKPVTPSSKGNFFSQAKVTDVKEPAVRAMPSPKAPRRVSFVTLSSPKNKKKC